MKIISKFLQAKQIASSCFRLTVWLHDYYFFSNNLWDLVMLMMILSSERKMVRWQRLRLAKNTSQMPKCAQTSINQYQKSKRNKSNKTIIFNKMNAHVRTARDQTYFYGFSNSDSIIDGYRLLFQFTNVQKLALSVNVNVFSTLIILGWERERERENERNSIPIYLNDLRDIKMRCI